MQVGIEAVEVHIHGIAVHLLGPIHGAEHVRPAGAGVLLVDAVQAPGHVGGGHLAIAPLELHAFAQMKAIAFAVIQDLIRIGQGLRRVVQTVLADAHQRLVASIEIHAVEGARGLEAVGATDLAKVGDVQGTTARFLGQ